MQIKDLTKEEIRAGIDKIKKDLKKNSEALRKQFKTEEAHRLEVIIKEFIDNEEINEKEVTKKINEVYKKIIPLNYLLIKLDEIYGFIFVKDLHKYAEFMFNNKLI